MHSHTPFPLCSSLLSIPFPLFLLPPSSFLLPPPSSLLSPPSSLLPPPSSSHLAHHCVPSRCRTLLRVCWQLTPPPNKRPLQPGMERRERSPSNREKQSFIQLFHSAIFLSPCAGMLTHSSSLIMESKSPLGELPAYPSLLVFLSLSLGLLSPSLQAPYLPPSCPRTSSLSHASPLSLLPCFPLSPLTQWLEVSEV